MSVIVAVHAACLLFMVLIILCEHATAARRTEGRSVTAMAAVCSAFFAADTAWVLYEDGAFGTADRTVNLLLTSASFTLLSLALCIWAGYCLGFVDRRVREMDGRFFLAVPSAVLAVTLAAPESGSIYGFGSSGALTTGPNFWIMTVLLVSPMVLVIVYALISAHRSGGTGEMRESGALAVSAAPVLIMAGAEYFQAPAPHISVGLTVSALLIYLGMKRRLVLVDPLTRIGNRREAERTVRDIISGCTPGDGRTLHLAVMDIDRFKSINDTYGHTEGDAALALFASVLERACNGTDCSPMRFAGDEFVIVGRNVTEGEFEEVCGMVVSLCTRIGKPYTVRPSIGIARYPEDGRTFAELFGKADGEMFADKRSEKAV